MGYFLAARCLVVHLGSVNCGGSVLISGFCSGGKIGPGKRTSGGIEGGCGLVATPGTSGIMTGVGNKSTVVTGGALLPVFVPGLVFVPYPGEG